MLKSNGRAVALALALAMAVAPMVGCATERGRTVRAEVQMRPGGPVEEVEMGVHEVPVNPPSIPASGANLDDDELVLGLAVDSTPIAYPIRFLATVEVANDRVGDAALAPTW